MQTENQKQASVSPVSRREVSVLIELTLGHLHNHLTEVPPHPNSPPDNVVHTDRQPREVTLVSKMTLSPYSDPILYSRTNSDYCLSSTPSAG